jgi:Tfp pilus assembly protein PilO
MPWRRLAAAWVPAVAICVAAGGVFLWQVSGSAGRESRVLGEADQLEAEIRRLERIREEAGAERAAVAELDRQFSHLYDDVFGDLNDRLTRILRAVHTATREAGLQPGSFSYTAAEERKTGYVRFGIQFAVEGDYAQLRRLLASLQASPEFLIIENVGIDGERESNRQPLKIGIRVATYLAEADQETLRRLTGGIRAAGTTEDVADQGQD